MPRLLFILVSFTFLSACSSTHSKKQSLDSKLNLTTQHDMRQISGVNLKTVSSLDSIAQKLSKYRTIFVGEIHTNYGHHLNQLAIIKNLHKHWGKNTSIGLEMVQTPYQSFLDKYVAGEIGEKDLLRGIEWYQRWGYEFRLYRSIFEYAKQYKIPLVALNISKELTKRITKVGIKGLSPQERMQLPPIINRSNKDYTRRITAVFKGHAHTNSKNADKFIDAQLGWDEGMAFSAAKYLNKNASKRMVILVGSGHVVAYQGIPDRLDRQINSKSAVVLSHVEDDSVINIENSGDFLLLSSEVKLPPKVQLGIGMEDVKEANGGVKVTRVLKHSAAEKAGLIIDDVITMLDDQVISDSLDLITYLEGVRAGTTVNIIAKRSNQWVELQVLLKSKINTHLSLKKSK